MMKKKKIAMIIAFRDFRDEEYFVPKDILEGAGVEIKTVSTQEGTAIGADGGEVEIDLLISEINIDEFADLQGKSSHDSIQSISSFDAVVFIGGPGALKYLDNEDSYRVAKETVLQDKPIAAICISPVILAKAGVLEGKQATVWSSPMDREPVRTLKDYGAVYQDLPVVIDGKVITGNGPASAKRFAEAIVMLLTEI
ncbi:MAG: DJ-1/PfpI family protein [bacterium]|nr:DJ-1/PfpI family protein [bacterium]